MRTKGTAKKVGLIEAFEDREHKGYSWNNMMLQRWTDHEGVEHRVLDRYEENKTLIDLTCQPPEIKQNIDNYLMNLQPKQVGMVGAKFMKFCGKFELERMSQSATQMAEILGKSLPKETV